MNLDFISASGLKVKITEKIEEISPQDWNIAFPDVLENYNFFKTLDESNFAEFSSYYVVVYENDAPMGATSCFAMNFPLLVGVDGVFKKFADLMNKVMPQITTPKVLFCGLPMGQGRIGLIREPAKVIKAICEAMELLAKKEKASLIAFKDVVSKYRQALDSLLDEGFFRIDSLPTTDMEISFASFEEYLKTLGNVSRNGFKRKFKKIDSGAKVDLEITNKLDEGALEEVHKLYMQTVARQEIGLETVTPDFFKNISKNMPDEAKFFLWRINGKMAAFALCLVKGDYFIDYYLGFDYSIAYEHHLYFVRFRDLMNWCIENKMKKYEMGPTGYEPKRRLGFNIVPLYIYAKHRNKFFNPIFKAVGRVVQPSNFHPIFKEIKK